MYILDTTKAMQLGYLTSLAGLFRGEKCEIVREIDDTYVVIKLPNSLTPEKEIRVSRDCVKRVVRH